MGRLNKALFGISSTETLVERRGFTVVDARVKARIEQIGASFVEGYHAALLENQSERLAATLNAAPLELRGFVFEGAAMGLMISDFVAPWRASRWQAFLDGPGHAHLYILYVGAGWALARLPVSVSRMLKNMDPLLRWLAVDGYGFHEGYFHANNAITDQRYPSGLSGYGCCAFDQGLGRSLWFVHGADEERIANSIGSFPEARRSALWGGLGLAVAYAGGVEAKHLENLVTFAENYRPQLAQGAAFAAKARQRAGNPAEHTETACRIICKMSLDQAAKLTDDALLALPADSALPAYEHWRQRIQQHFMSPGWLENR